MTQERQRYFHHCQQCGWDWASWLEHPKKCPNPKCPNPFYWYRPRAATYLHHCAQCERDWESRSENPIRCPHCSSRDWDKAPAEPREGVV
jgi:predicted Zn-ribbon and HTH transcriptional regulator